MTKIIGVTLSGNKNIYFYTAEPAQLLNANVGDRVVVPNKLGDEGKVSLSIGTYEGAAPADMDFTGQTLKPIVQFIDSANLLAAKVWLERAAKAAA